MNESAYHSTPANSGNPHFGTLPTVIGNGFLIVKTSLTNCDLPIAHKRSTSAKRANAAPALEGTIARAKPGSHSLFRDWVFMYEVTVEDTFAAGHYLRNYKGKCENPHGHNYKVRVTLAGNELDKAGLLLDFRDLKDVMKHVIDRLDHQMINEIEPFTVLNPSAENLSKYFYDETNIRLKSVTNGRVRVKDVTVFETDTTTAKYSE
jgi:6-pyruvoyltetrahydropterin/6-carboxytetrahydropterin synthase